jgi:hypothetical protein
MKIRFNVQFNVQVVHEPARAPRPRRLRRLPTLSVVGLVALMLFVPFAFASDVFTDVPASHPFHDQIQRAYAAGMIGACAGSPPPPNQTFCPGNTITKGSAANQYDKAFGLDGTPRPFTPTWRQVNILTGGSLAPLLVDSQVKVTNLNADLLDGMNAADFATKSELAAPGTINAPGNPVDWSNLKNVPAGFADGSDDGGGATYSAGEGLTLNGNTFGADFGSGHNQVARGDHSHFGDDWTGSGPSGLFVNNNGASGCAVAALSGQAGPAVGVGYPCRYSGVLGASGDGIGVAGTSVSDNGVWGVSSSAAGVYGASSTAAGVSGSSNSGNGVFGSSTSGDAGYFDGNVRITGDLQLDGGGVVKSVGAGTGLTSGGGASAPVLGLDPSYRLPQGCAGGSSPRFNTPSGVWTCTPNPASFFSAGDTGATTTIGTSCTNYSGGQIIVNVPSPGATVIVDARAWLKLNHTSGVADAGAVMIGTTPTDCGDVYNREMFTVSAADSTVPAYDLSASPRGIYPNQAPGLHTYYLNGAMSQGADANDHFWFAGLTAQALPNG